MADLLIIAPHPDDAEIHAGALIAAHVRQGRSVAVVDATRGGMATRGTPEQREREAAAAAQVLGLAARDNLGLPDGGIPADDPAARALVAEAIRRHRPRAVICLHAHARHPDHQNLAALVGGAVKAAALHGLRTASPAVPGVRLWWVEAELPVLPTLLVPCTEADWERKRAAVLCHASQFTRGDGPATTISDPGFLAWIEARGRTWGHQAGAAYAEALCGPEAARVGDLTAI